MLDLMVVFIWYTEQLLAQCTEQLASLIEDFHRARKMIWDLRTKNLESTHRTHL